MRSVRLVSQLVALAVVGALLGALVWRLTHQPHTGRTGGPAPLFTAKLLAGDGTLSLTSLRGKPVVLNFFQSSCGPCKAESKVLEAAYRRYRSQGVVFVGVDFQDALADARRFVRVHGITYPVVRDPGPIVTRYGLIGTPETFFIDRRGRLASEPVIGTVVNQTKGFENGIRAAIDS
jgi:cytochrome c biogenesis protein CcmG/thiol:disulfide interchange protein DsbE